MNKTGARGVGWRVALAAATLVGLVSACLVATPVAADTPLPIISLTYQPTLSENGPTYVGTTASVTTGTWWPTPTSYSYAWFRNGLPIAGATSSQYTPTTADEGQNISYSVTAELDGFQPGVVTERWTSIPGPDVLTPVQQITPPVVNGTPKVGVPLTVTPGTFTPSDAKVIYWWFGEDGTQVDPADANASFTPTADDIGHGLYLRYYATGYLYQPFAKQLMLPQVLPLALAAPAPTITGSQLVGSTLTARGSWNATPDTVDYQWMRNGADIDGATSSTYVTAPSDVGDVIQVRMTGHLADLDPLTVTATSTFTVAVPFATTPQPTISGSPYAGSNLTAVPGDWGVPGMTFTYAWYIGSVRGWETANYFPLDWSVVGKTISVVVTGTGQGFGPTTSVSSVATAPIQFLPSPVSTVTIPAIRVHQYESATYTLRPGDEGVPLTYAWQRNGVAIPGATSAGYETQPADLGTKLSVAISTTNRSYDPTPVTSNTQIVAEGYMAGGVTITGPVRVGSTVGVETDGWPAGPITFKYQWMVLGSTNFNPYVSTRSTYTIPAALLGHQLNVLVKGYEPGYITQPEISYNSQAVTVARGLLAVRAAPAITGLPSVGSRLTASRGTVSPTSGVTYRYQWFSATSSTATVVAIPRATATTYVPTAALRGHLISVRVTASKAAYATESTFSAPTRALLPRITVRPHSVASAAHILR